MVIRIIEKQFSVLITFFRANWFNIETVIAVEFTSKLRSTCLSKWVTAKYCNYEWLTEITVDNCVDSGR